VKVTLYFVSGEVQSRNLGFDDFMQAFVTGKAPFDERDPVGSPSLPLESITIYSDTPGRPSKTVKFG